MRAVVHDRYGDPDVLRVDDIEQPTPKADELLIQVYATTVNRTDSGFRAAKPFIVRFFAGLRRPKRRVLGSEFAGIVEEVGAAVGEFKVGDRVFGVNADRFGAHAEYLCLRERDQIAPMPAGVTFEEAAAICDGAIIALSILRRAGIHEGQTIAVYGASGSIGTAGVQLAKHFGADVTAVCNTKNVEIVRSLGADRVIDYTQEDFTKDRGTYDIVFDAVGKQKFRRCRRALRRGGVYASTDLGFLCQNPILALLTSRTRFKRVMFPLPKYTKENVHFLKEIIEAGRLRAVIDRCYPLAQVVEATTYVETGQKTGNVVLTVRGVET